MPLNKETKPNHKTQTLPKTDRPWFKIHMNLAGPLDGSYYLIVVDSFSKWREIFNCKKATTEVVTSFLHELFTRFGVEDCLVSDSESQFMFSEFKEFYQTFSVKHIMITPYHPGGTFRWHFEEIS